VKGLGVNFGAEIGLGVKGVEAISHSVFVHLGSYFQGCFLEPVASSPGGKFRNRRSQHLSAASSPLTLFQADTSVGSHRKEKEGGRKKKEKFMKSMT
jgi:hypothetical protein